MESLIRQLKIRVFINNKDVTRELSNFILEVLYTDSIEEKAKDELQLTLSNLDRRFLKDWAIEENSRIDASIIADGQVFRLGTFYVGDSFTLREKGSVLTISATSQSYEDLKAFKVVRNESYENITLKDLVLQIISKCSKKSFVDAPEIPLTRIDIVNETYEQFLKRLARDYNCKFFIRAGTVVFARNLPTREWDITPYLVNDDIRFKPKKEAVKAVEMEYYKPGSKETLIYREENPEVKEGRTIKIWGIAHNLKEAQEKVRATLEKSKSELKAEATFTIYGQPINAGDYVVLPEELYGFIGGKYQGIQFKS
jgi:hypothetical protein